MRPLFVLALTVLAGGCSLLEPSAPSTAPSPTTPTPAAPAAATPESAPAKAAKPPGDGWTDLGGGRFVRASSTLSSKNDLYVPAHLVDGDPKTTWVEGASGVGQGEWIELWLAEPRMVDALLLRPGYVASLPQLIKNATPKVLGVQVGDETFDAPVLGMAFSTTDAGLEEEPHLTDATGIDDCRLEEDDNNLLPRLLFLGPARPVQQVKLTIRETYSPGKDLDTVLSELTLVGPDDTPAEVAPLLTVLRALDAETVDGARIAPDARVALLGEPRVTLMERWKGSVGSATPESILTFAKASNAGGLQRAFGAVEPLADGSVRFTGGAIAGDGDGEWIEAYPVLELDGEGRITLATDAIRFDGAPGCHRTWGTDVQR